MRQVLTCRGSRQQGAVLTPESCAERLGKTDAAIVGRAAAQADNQVPTPGVQRRLYLFAQPVAAGLTHIRCAGGVSSSPQLCAISIMARSPGRIRKSACRKSP